MTAQTVREGVTAMAQQSDESDRLRHEQLAAVTIGEPHVLEGPVTLVEYDPAWPLQYVVEAGRVRAALGERVLRVEHVGSTSVPGLLAKPILDMLLVVAESADESAYVPDLEADGYVLRIREPDWHEHRLLKRTRPDLNLHVFSLGSSEINRMIQFRDRLRSDPADRALYADAKRRLAARRWRYLQDYADAKTEVVQQILGSVDM
jgi:GrpB-like predicted nucleotidyltransferase (UPF0157 family)